MGNVKPEIKGYRTLSAEEIALINETKNLGLEIEKLINKIQDKSTTDLRWIEIAKIDLQKGMMGLARSIAKPSGF
jgi:hypothetical protein